MNILLIETATSVCSVALAQDERIVARRQSTDPNAHSTRLTVFIDEILREAAIKPHQVDAVCVSSGPGSYTGLRIGVSTAKGLCYALEKPLLSVPTLLSMAALYYAQHPDYKGFVCPMIDARRMECYTMIVDHDLNILRDTHADVFDSEDTSLLSPFDTHLEKNTVVFIGDGAAKTKPVFSSYPNARFDDHFSVAAEGMATIALRKLQEGRVEDVAYFEPFYLKDFVAKKSVVHGLR